MIKFGGYSIGIAQNDDESKEKLNFRICSKSTISLLVSRSDMPNMSCFSIDGMENRHDAILDPFGTTEEIIISLTRLPWTTYTLLSSSPTLKILNSPLLLLFSMFEIILSQILTLPQNTHHRKVSKSNYDLAAKPP